MPVPRLQRLEPAGRRALRLGHRQAVEEIRIDERAGLVGIGLVGDHEARGVGIGRQHDRDDRQRVFPREIEIALVVRRAAEDRARAIFHQHEIRDIDRQRRAGPERVARAQAGVEALFLGGLEHRLARPHAVAFGDEGGEAGIAARQFLGERMVGREGAEGGAEQRIGPGGEDLEPVGAACRARTARARPRSGRSISPA